MKIIKSETQLNHQLSRYNIPSFFQDFKYYRPYISLVRFEKNEELYQTENQRNYLIFFLSGKVKVCADMANGKSLLIVFYTSFQLLGDLELFSVDTSETTVQAVDSCLCITLHVSKVRNKLMKDPVFLKYIAGSLANKLAAISRTNSINTLYSLENKLASYIFQVSNGEMFSENLTHLADLLGTSYRHLLRVLKEFQEKGILKKTASGYAILDLKRLEALTEDLYLT